jgi:DNA invertase Pin-like site-specific DNA recombinase
MDGTMARKTPVVGYIRVSSVGGRAGDSFISPELQRQSIERVCEREGLELLETFEELDASGGDATRPTWNKVIELVEQGTYKGIVCWNLSRFSRSTKDALAALERIENAGGKLYSEEGTIGKLDRTIRLAIAEDERDRAKAGFWNAATNAIKRAVYIAGKIPYGYRRDAETRKLVVDPEAALIVKELFERRAKGQSWAELSKWAVDVHGRYFARETLRGMMLNPAYLGHARYGELLNEKAHEPIVSRLLFDKAQKIKGRKPVSTGRSETLLVRGILTCATCGHKMVVSHTRGANRQSVSAYHCRNLACEARAFTQAEPVDSYVVESVLELLRSSQASFKTKGKGMDAQELARAEKELEEAEYALEQFKSNKKAIIVMGVDDWNQLLEEYVLARDVAQTEVEVLREQKSHEEWEHIHQLWEEWTTESRREFLHKIISECSIRPAHRQKIPVSDRIEIAVKPGNLPMNFTLRTSQLPEGWEMEFDD